MLTEKQNKVLEAIKEFQALNGLSPTVRELADHFGQSSTAGIHKILNILKTKGYLYKDGQGKSRSLRLKHYADKNINTYPVLGQVVAGHPRLAVEEKEGDFVLDSEWVGQEDVFILRVDGHSMVDADIHDNDLIVVQYTQECRNGDIVIALLENEATVKRFFKEKNRIRLQPENSNMQPIYININDPSFRIIGKVKGLLRKF